MTNYLLRFEYHEYNITPKLSFSRRPISPIKSTKARSTLRKITTYKRYTDLKRPIAVVGEWRPCSSYFVVFIYLSLHKDVRYREKIFTKKIHSRVNSDFFLKKSDIRLPIHGAGPTISVPFLTSQPKKCTFVVFPAKKKLDLWFGRIEKGVQVFLTTSVLCPLTGIAI
jgi:hypothetical protein